MESTITEKTEAEASVPLSKEELRGRMHVFESALGQTPGAKFGDDACPVEHHFGDGLYIREMKGIKGTVVVTKLHKTNHPYFVMAGDVSIITEDGPVRVKAPYWGITKAGTKRVGYFHEDTIWITVHSTKETDLEKIEEETIAQSYDELPEDVKLRLGIESEVQLCLGS